jgi:hypothetical protein
MRRLHLGMIGLSLCAATLCVVLAGCGGGDKKDEDETTSVSKGKGGKGKGGKGGGKSEGGGGSEMTAIEGKGTATLKGKITATGGDVDKVLSDNTQQLLKLMSTKDTQYCESGESKEKTGQVYRIGTNRQVGNVVVFVKPPRGSYFKVDEKQVKEAKDHPVVIDQPHCVFLPHVSVAFSKYHDPKNPRELLPAQQVVIKNGAQIAHNTKWEYSNQTIPKESKLDPADPAPNDRKVYELECSIHPWMRGYLWALDHPFAAVSLSDTGPHPVKADDRNFGTYEIKGLPSGVKLLLCVWHEKAGFVNANGVNGQEIELKEGENTQDFEVPVKE